MATSTGQPTRAELTIYGNRLQAPSVSQYADCRGERRRKGDPRRRLRLRFVSAIPDISSFFAPLDYRRKENHEGAQFNKVFLRSLCLLDCYGGDVFRAGPNHIAQLLRLRRGPTQRRRWCWRPTAIYTARPTVQGPMASMQVRISKSLPAAISAPYTTFVSNHRTAATRLHPLKMIQGRDANFYGVTQYGGDIGNIFKLTPSGNESSLFTFCSPLQ